ncbi:MAG: nucleotidyl transferase AbiEii/AbiGii toxin family protein [bacterium]
MEQIIRSRLDKSKSREENVHLVREFLQLLVLRIIYETNYFQYISFIGGTSLRFLYQLQRFSEDLDFSVTQKKGYDFKNLMRSLEYHLQKFGFHVEIKSKEQKVVHSAYLKFVHVLQQFDISRMKDEKLSIRIEIDSNPPDGWQNEMSVINDFFIFPVWHFDLPSLFATKIHACFFRKYKKGRDYYDLMWYLSKKILPNFLLLNNAIKQTEDVELKIEKGNFKQFLHKRIEPADFSYLRRDVEPFLVNNTDVNLINGEVFSELIDAL